MASRKHYNFEILRKVLEYVAGMRSDINSCLDNITCGKNDGQFDIIWGI